MRVPLSWLADYVAVETGVDDLAHRLTMAGLKVESIERIGETWTDVVIGEVVEIEPHPTSKKPLWVTKTNLGGRFEEVAPELGQDGAARDLAHRVSCPADALNAGGNAWR